MFLPINSNIGLTLANVASLPPTMMVSEAPFAPSCPPDTGASRYSHPSAFIFCANSLLAIGEIELISTTILPLLMPVAMPFSPNRTFSTSGVSGTMVMIMSALLATSAALEQTIAALLTNSCGTWLRVLTYTVCPAANK